MPGRRGWSDGIRNGPAAGEPDPLSEQQRRAAARTVASASTDVDDLRLLLSMLGLDDLHRIDEGIDEGGHREQVTDTGS